MHGMKWSRGALLKGRISSSTVSWLYVLLLSIACLVHRQVPFATAQGSDFISIDCGSLTNTSNWTTDGSYTSLGSNKKAGNAVLPYDTLRYFPDKTVSKSCYTFNTTTNLPYLIRAGFYYGDYDNLSSTEGLPSFDLLFEASYWSRVNFTSVIEIITHEMLALATSGTMSVCLARSNSTSNYNPFISSLEIRPLSTNQNMYSPVHENFLMKTNSRINFGDKSNKSVRYPLDVYDRIWQSDQVAITGISTYNTTLSTNNNVSAASSNDSPPSKVMQTARSPNGMNMSFSFTAKHGPGQYYLAFYFAELENRSSPRVMDMYIDDHESRRGLNFSERGRDNTLEIYHNNYTVNSTSYSLFLVSDNTSTGPPIVNAAESYFLAQADQGTFDKDVQALQKVKSVFNLSIWGGDPCLPAAYKWVGLVCDNSSSLARVIGLNLSNMNLHGEIPSAIADLTALTTVDLHDNALVGNVPASFAGLQSLVFLDVSYNNLSGDFPTNFRNGINISTTGNPFLCRNDSCGMGPAPAPSRSVSSSHSRSSTGLIVGLVVTATIFFVATIWVLCFYKRKLQKQKTLRGTRSAHWPPVPPFTEISKAMDPVLDGQNGNQDNVPLYSFADIQIITSNFERRIVGPGNSGTLFHGVLSDGQEVVVKFLHSSIEHCPTDFLYQVSPLWYVNHKNLLRPIGFCAEMHRLMLVYEHIQKGSLYEYLHNKHALDWKTRLGILQQVAQGLEHLHHACSPSIIHGNLKSTNVLLSGDGLMAKVSDFGLHGVCPNGDATSGYLDPQYPVTQKLTEKSDVYSFGVLMLEVICGRIPFDTSLPREAQDLVDWVRQVQHEGGDKVIAGSCLHGSYNRDMLLKVVNIALQATQKNAFERPTMAELVVELKEANKVEVGHHVAFLEVDASEFSHSSDVHSPPAYRNGIPMEDDVE